jgi:hypothetical protein
VFQSFSHDRLDTLDAPDALATGVKKEIKTAEMPSAINLPLMALLLFLVKTPLSEPQL